MHAVHYAKMSERMDTYSYYFARQCKHLAPFCEFSKPYTNNSRDNMSFSTLKILKAIT